MERIINYKFACQRIITLNNSEPQIIEQRLFDVRILAGKVCACAGDYILYTYMPEKHVRL
jgi:hypothetical protein